MGYYGFLIIESIPSIKDCLMRLNVKKVNPKHEHLIEKFREDLPDKL